MRSGRPFIHNLFSGNNCRKRNPAAKRLRRGQDVRLYAKGLICIQFPGSSNTGLHLIENQQNTIFITYCPQPLKECFFRNNISTLSLHWFHNDCRHTFRSYHFLENLFKLSQTFHVTFSFFLSERTTVTVRIIRPVNCRKQRFVIFPVRRIGTGNGYCRQRASVKGIPEADNPRSFCDIFRQLDCPLICFRTGIAEIYLCVTAGQLHQLFRQCNVRFIIHDVMPHMYHIVQFVFNHCNYPFIAASDVVHGNSACKVQKPSPVLCIQICSLRACYPQRRRTFCNGRHYLHTSLIHALHHFVPAFCAYPFALSSAFFCDSLLFISSRFYPAIIALFQIICNCFPD